VDVFAGLMQGFAVALQPANLLWCLLGVVLGTVVGVMPGLAPSGTIAMLLPLTFAMNPAAAMIMLAGIYYGAKYGGSTTAILLNVPGESASVVTCLDGHQMARNGRAGPALGIAAIASFIAGTVGVLGLMLVAPPLARMALAFSSPEYFALMALGLAMVVLLAGLWISSIGTDAFSTTSRFTFGQLELLSGIDFVVVAIGVFAVGEVLACMETRAEGDVGGLGAGSKAPEAPASARARDAMAKQSAPSLTARAAPADVRATWRVEDRATALRELEALVTRVGGGPVTRHAEGAVEVVEFSVPREAYEDVTSVLEWFGRLTVVPATGPLPAVVRVSLRVTG